MRNNTFTIPNLLTFLRIALIPVTAYLIVKGIMFWAFIVFFAACMTDLLDGYIARKYNLVSKLGIWLDPLADKLMAITVLLMFIVKGIVPLAVLIVILAKEMILLLGGLIALRKGVSTPSNQFGKIAAFLLNASIASGFFHQCFTPWDVYAMYFAAGVTVIALVQYIVINGHLIFQKREDQEE